MLLCGSKLDSSFAFDRAGLLSGTTFLSLTWYIDKERDFLPVKAAMTGIAYMHSLLTKEEDKKNAEVILVIRTFSLFKATSYLL